MKADTDLKRRDYYKRSAMLGSDKAENNRMFVQVITLFLTSDDPEYLNTTSFNLCFLENSGFCY